MSLGILSLVLEGTSEYARVAQLVEHDLAKVGAAGSSPVSRSIIVTQKCCEINVSEFFIAQI